VNFVHYFLFALAMPTQAKRALKNPLQKALWRPKNGERTRGKGIKYPGKIIQANNAYFKN
jgi:hypothetical protein